MALVHVISVSRVVWLYDHSTHPDDMSSSELPKYVTCASWIELLCQPDSTEVICASSN